MPSSVYKKGDERPQRSMHRARWWPLSLGPVTPVAHSHPKGILGFHKQRLQIVPDTTPMALCHTRQRTFMKWARGFKSAELQL